MHVIKGRAVLKLKEVAKILSAKYLKKCYIYLCVCVCVRVCVLSCGSSFWVRDKDI